MTSQIGRITIYGMVYVHFSEVIRMVNATKLDLQLTLKRNESGKEIDIPVVWKIVDVKD